METLENNWRQAVQAYTCPLNRAMTMVEHSCDEWGLFYHPDWLVMHYINNGGAKAFAIMRDKQAEIEAMEPEYYI